jgi:hypothetical protein
MEVAADGWEHRLRRLLPGGRPLAQNRRIDQGWKEAEFIPVYALTSCWAAWPRTPVPALRATWGQVGASPAPTARHFSPGVEARAIQGGHVPPFFRARRHYVPHQIGG